MKKIDISKFYPCQEGLLYYSKQPSSIDAWNNCERGDWMLWMAKNLGVNERRLSLAKGLCAETVIHLMGDERSRKAVKAAIAYGKKEISEKKLGSAHAAAADAYFAAAAANVAYVDYADFAVAAAAASSATAHTVATTAAFVTAAYASDIDGAEAARKSSLKQTSDICREILTGGIKRILGV